MEEELINETGKQVDDMTQDYLEAIKTLKQNSVDRSEYDKLKTENKRLLDSVVNGTQVEVEKPIVYTDEDIQALRNDLFNPEKDHTNLEYISKTLELRKALMMNGKADPFIPVGKQISPTEEDIRVANKVAQVYQECIDYAQGDSEAFTNELQRRTNDVRINRKR